MTIENDKNELNTVGQVLGQLLCEKYEIPEDLVDTWEATGDSDVVRVDVSVHIDMTMDEFNALLDRAKTIGAPGV